MPEIPLAAELRTQTGTRGSKRLRHAGKVPAVLYGHGSEPLPIAVDARALRHALTGESGINALLRLELDGRRQLAMAKDVQRDPLRGRVAHVDFIIVGRDEVVTADIPVTLVGEARAVLSGDGVVGQELFNLSVTAPATSIPAAVEIDISDLQIGDTIRVGDVRLPDGVEATADPELAVVVAQPPQVTPRDLVAEGEEPPPPGEAPSDLGAEGREQQGEAAAAEAAGAPAETQPTIRGGE